MRSVPAIVITHASIGIPLAQVARLDRNDLPFRDHVPEGPRLARLPPLQNSPDRVNPQHDDSLVSFPPAGPRLAHGAPVVNPSDRQTTVLPQIQLHIRGGIARIRPRPSIHELLFKRRKTLRVPASGAKQQEQCRSQKQTTALSWSAKAASCIRRAMLSAAICVVHHPAGAPPFRGSLPPCTPSSVRAAACVAARPPRRTTRCPRSSSCSASATGHARSSSSSSGSHW